ncbi:MAG: YhbY family RNA-binding protein, partial [Syntrophobacteraceae bacterium]
MGSLTTTHRAYLRSLILSLKPIVRISKDGVTEAAVNSIEDTFNN